MTTDCTAALLHLSRRRWRDGRATPTRKHTNRKGRRVGGGGCRGGKSSRRRNRWSFRRQAHQGQLNWYPSLVQRIGMSERPSQTLRTASQTETAKLPGYLSTWVHGDMAGMGSTAKAVDAGVAGFNWNSPLVAPLARPGAQGSRRRGWEKTDEPWRAWSLPTPPFLAAFQGLPFPWPTSHPAMVATSRSPISPILSQGQAG